MPRRNFDRTPAERSDFRQGCEWVWTGVGISQIQALSTGPRAEKIEVLGSAETNDLGEYRLSGLDPGTYQLRATYARAEAANLIRCLLRWRLVTTAALKKPAEIAVKAGFGDNRDPNLTTKFCGKVVGG